jgi:hypothetical protein
MNGEIFLDTAEARNKMTNIINWRSSTKRNVLEPKSHLVVAIMFEILALHIILVRYWEINCGLSTAATNLLQS